MSAASTRDTSTPFTWTTLDNAKVRRGTSIACAHLRSAINDQHLAAAGGSPQPLHHFWHVATTNAAN